jgi:hypothetical protein
LEIDPRVEQKDVSHVGKQLMIKACAHTIPVFAVTCFDLTKSFYDQINMMINRFFLGKLRQGK